MTKYTSFAFIAMGLTSFVSGCGDDEGAPSSKSGVGGSSTLGGAPASGGSDGKATGGQGGDTSASGGTSTGTAGSSSSTGASNGGSASTSVSSANCNDTATLDTTLSGQYNGAAINVTGKEKSYQATTNWWHKYTDQSINVKGIGYVVDNSSNVSVPQTDGAPIGYPTIFIGTYAGSTTKGSNLPKQVSQLTNVYTVMETNSLSLDTANFNAAYDVWLTKSSSPLPETQYSPGVGGAFLMVWLFDPASRQPRGANRFPAHAVPGVPGTWDVWIDATDPPCISYVSTTPLNSLAFDLNSFIKDSVANSYGVTNDMYLSVVFGGFEIWGGGDGLELKNFCADVK